MSLCDDCVARSGENGDIDHLGPRGKCPGGGQGSWDEARRVSSVLVVRRACAGCSPPGAAGVRDLTSE